MARTASTMLPLGTVAPTFHLPDTISGKEIAFEDIQGEIGTVVMFICNHCPYVIHVQDQLVSISIEYQPKHVSFVAISANDAVAYPEDSPDKMKLFAQRLGFNFPYLYDESQQTAKAYEAACTPDFYVFDRNNTCVYRGRMDESTPGNNLPVTGAELRRALDHLIQAEAIDANQFQSVGCGIKWK